MKKAWEDIVEAATGPMIDLDRGELLLLDWVLCAQSRLIPNADLDYLLGAWHDFRLSIWSVLNTDPMNDLTSPSIPAAKFHITESEAKALLALTPTTFRWGTGPDCGYSLKQKLAKFLLPQEESHGDKDEAKTDNQAAANAKPAD